LAAGIPPDHWWESMSTLQRTRIPLPFRSHCKMRMFAPNIRYSIPQEHRSVQVVSWWSSICILPDHQSQSIRSSLPPHIHWHCHPFRHRMSWSTEWSHSSIPLRGSVPAEWWSSSIGIPPDRRSQSIRSSPRHRRLCCCRPFRHRTSWSMESLRSNIQLHPKAKVLATRSLVTASALESAEHKDQSQGLRQSTCTPMPSRKRTRSRSSSNRKTTSSESFQRSIQVPASSSVPVAAW